MKENHFIGNILSEQENSSSYPPSRSSSAPPIMPDTPHGGPVSLKKKKHKNFNIQH